MSQEMKLHLTIISIFIFLVVTYFPFNLFFILGWLLGSFATMNFIIPSGCVELFSGSGVCHNSFYIWLSGLIYIVVSLTSNLIIKILEK